MCGLGKGIAQTGNMDPASVERALTALHRFKALSKQARARTMYALATAAAREAANGPISSEGRSHSRLPDSGF